MQIEVKYIDDDEVEVTLTLPARHEVCYGCEGHGTVLCEGMRGHAYTMSEFQEEFDPEEQAEYFKRGGRYDVTCSDCGGKRVIAVPDEQAITGELRMQYDAYVKAREEQAKFDAYCAAERRAEMRMGC